jgi:transcriptional regulator with XRE-family HTH domain
MSTASVSSFGVGVDMLPMSQIVTLNASPNFHSLCGAPYLTVCDTAGMADVDKNGGPNFLKAWREFRKLTQQDLADLVDTNANMIGYLESGERGLSAKWLRRLAPALDTTPGMLLDHDPRELDSDVIDIWAHADRRQKSQISEIAKTIVRTGTTD